MCLSRQSLYLWTLLNHLCKINCATALANSIDKLIQLFWRLEQTRFFRYLVAGGTATLVDIGSYTVFASFVFTSQAAVPLGLPISWVTVSLVCSFSLGLITNFLINRFYVFSESQVNAGTQFGRFFIVSIFVFVANQLAMKGLYEIVPLVIPDLPETLLHLSVRSTAALVIAFLSFTSHKFFSFEMQKSVPEVINLNDDPSTLRAKSDRPPSHQVESNAHVSHC